MTKEIKTYRANTKDEQFEKAWKDAVEKVDTIKADRAILIASNGVELIVSLTADETELHRNPNLWLLAMSQELLNGQKVICLI